MTLGSDLGELPEDWTHYNPDAETDLFVRPRRSVSPEIVVATQQSFSGRQVFNTYYLGSLDRPPVRERNGFGTAGADAQLASVAAWIGVDVDGGESA